MPSTFRVAIARSLLLRHLQPIPPLTIFTSTLQLQLHNQTGGLCWGATYSPPFDKATAEQLKDTSE